MTYIFIDNEDIGKYHENIVDLVFSNRSISWDSVDEWVNPFMYNDEKSSNIL